MPKFNARDILIPTISLVLITGVSTVLLAGTNELTKEPISVAEETGKQKSMQSVSPKNADSYVKIDTEDVKAECYEVLDKEGKVIAYTIATNIKGYGGTIKVMTGIDKNGSIIGVNVYDNSDETTGLGAKTSEKKFCGQFSSKSANTDFIVSKDAEKYPDSQKIDAVTGATISSRAVTEAVNRALELYREISGGVG